MDSRSGVGLLRYRYEVPFKFTGAIDKLTFELEPEPQKRLRRSSDLVPSRSRSGSRPDGRRMG